MLRNYTSPAPQLHTSGRVTGQRSTPFPTPGDAAAALPSPFRPNPLVANVFMAAHPGRFRALFPLHLGRKTE